MVHYYDFDIDNRVQRQAVSLAARGDEVHVISLAGPRRIAVGAGVIVLHRIDMPKRRGSPRAYIGGFLRFLHAAAARVRRITKGRRLDLISVHNTPDFIIGAALWPKLRGVPVILDVHDTFPEFFMETFALADHHPLARVILAEERLSIRAANAVVVVTETAKECLAARSDADTDIRVIMNTPDVKTFGPAQQPLPPPPRGPLRIAYHGGMARQYGVESLIRGVGLARQRDARIELTLFGLFGAFDELSQLAQRVDPHGIRVWPRPVPYTQMHEHLCEHHVGVVPTLSNRFTDMLLPVKLLEYVHLGRPVVASRLDGIMRYFDQRMVSFFEPGSPESIAQSLVDLSVRPQPALRRAIRAAERLEPIRWGVQEAAYFELVDELVWRSRTRSSVRRANWRPRSLKSEGRRSLKGVSK